MYSLVDNAWVKVGPDLIGERERGRFGSVSISGDGNVVGVGAPTNGRTGGGGEIEVWDRSPSP